MTAPVLTRCWLVALLGVLPSLAGAPFRQAQSIRGSVTDDTNEALPIRSAVVTLSGTPLQGAVSTLTDEAGRFQFLQVPDGEFHLIASKTPYLPMSYGSTIPGADGTGLRLSGSQAPPDLRIRLPRGGVLSGTISSSGEALGGLRVTAVRIQSRTVDRPPLTAAATTDALGGYRLFGLSPGKYLVGVVPSFSTQALGVLTLAADLLQDPKRPALPYALAPTFYPGVSDADRAVPVAVGIGESIGGLNIDVQPIRVSLIHGSVVGTSSSANLTGQLCAQGPPLPASLRRTLGVTVQRDSKFEVGGVFPGRYTLEVKNDALSSDPLFGTVDVTASGGDVEATVVLRRTQTLSGTIRYVADGVTTSPEPIVGDVSLIAVQDADACAVGRPPRITSRVAADKTFRLTGVAPGQYRLVFEGGPSSPWWIDKARLGGFGLLDGFLSASDEVKTQLEISLSNRKSGVTGRIQHPANMVVEDLCVVAFPRDHQLWRQGSPRLKLARPGSAGDYEIGKLPEGDYFVALVSGVSETDLDDLTLLNTFERLAVPVSIRTGTMARLDLQVQ